MIGLPPSSFDGNQAMVAVVSVMSLTSSGPVGWDGAAFIIKIYYIINKNVQFWLATKRYITLCSIKFAIFNYSRYFYSTAINKNVQFWLATKRYMCITLCSKTFAIFYYSRYFHSTAIITYILCIYLLMRLYFACIFHKGFTISLYRHITQ